MRARQAVLLALVSALLAPLPRLGADAAPPLPAAQDAVVIAVIDSGFSPYHQDFLADRMPEQARPDLTRAPHTWLPGFPAPSSFASYEALDLTLNGSSGVRMAGLHSADADQWAKERESSGSDVHYRWIPGTKVIGALTFGDDTDADKGTVYGEGGTEHGMGSASVATGNTFGTCPQCLLVFLQFTTPDSAEQALAWAGRQPWIDAVTNSYGFSQGFRERYYNGTDLVTSKAAAVRGQSTFFSSGNGQDGLFVVPNTTLLSSQEGPDWMVTVGATGSTDEDLTGTGKPVDVAGIGESYPSAFGAATVDGGGNFTGTSSATPQVAGIYGRALWEARRALPGGSRVQAAGVVAKGGRFSCGPVRSDCELRDSTLTAVELRARLFLGAKPTAGQLSPGGILAGPAVRDSRFLSEGHGNYRGKLGGKYEEEFATRVSGPLLGRAAAQQRPAGEIDWFRVDSWCRQLIWGDWPQGAFVDDSRTPLPPDDYATWPFRTMIHEQCPTLEQIRPGDGR